MATSSVASPSPTSPTDTAGAVPRSTLAVLVNAMSHSRVWLHQDIAQRLGLRVLTILLFDENNQRWDLALNPRDTLRLGPGEMLKPRTTLRSLFPAIRKGVACVRAVRRSRSSAVIVNGYNYVECWMLLAWCRLAGPPAFLAADSNLASDEGKSPLARTLKHAVVRAAAALSRGVLPIGRGGIEYYQRYGVPRDRMFVVPLGNDPELSRPLSRDERARVLASFGFAPHERVVLCSGRLADVKSWDVAIDAFAQVAKDRPAWVLAFAGDGPLRDALQARARAALGEAHARVRWLGQITEPRRNFELLRAIDVLLHPARFEPWGMVVQECVLAGKPVIVSRVTGAALDLVRDGVGGRVVEPGDVAAFAKALLDVTQDDALPRFAQGALATGRAWERDSDRCIGMHQALASVGVRLPPPHAPRADADAGTIEVVRPNVPRDSTGSTGAAPIDGSGANARSW